MAISGDLAVAVVTREKMDKNDIKAYYNAEDNPTTKNDLTQNVNSDEVEKSCTRTNSLNHCTRNLRKTTFDLRTEEQKTSITS